MPSGVVVLLNANDVYLSDDGGVNVAMSNQASLEMNDNPAMMANSSASPPTIMASSVISMFQTNCVAIRAERFINWSRRHDAAVSMRHRLVGATPQPRRMAGHSNKQ